MALLVETILTVIVVDKVGLDVDVQTQVIVPFTPTDHFSSIKNNEWKRPLD